MAPTQSAAPYPTPSHPNRFWRLMPHITIAAALATCLWIPVRVTYLSHVHRVAAIDHLLDLVVLAVMVANHRHLFRRGRAGGRFEAAGDSWWRVILDGAVALPLFTLLTPMLGADAKYTLLVKLLIFRHLFSVRRLLDEFDNLHPVLARLIPLALVVPTVVNALACGWSWLGSGTAGTNPDPRLDYVRAVYWTITTLTTVGYGDVTPRTPLQMGYAAFTMLVGVGFFGYVLGNIASLLARLDAAREQYLELLDRVDSFMRGNSVPAALRNRVREYHRYLWQSRRGWDTSAILAGLPPKLRVEVALFLNAEIIDKVPMLKGADRRLLEEIVLELKPRVVIRGEELFRSGEPGDAMYFIQRGEIEIVAADGTVLATLGAGSFFGESALLTARPRNAGARAASYCDVFLLNREAFERVLNRHPAFRQQVQAIAATRTGDTQAPVTSR